MHLNMSKKGTEFDCKFPTPDQLEKDATIMENNLESVNKQTIIKMLKVLSSIINIIKRKEDGIFSVLLKWFRLYLKLHDIIDPKDEMLLKFYENTVPTTITYIIGCLQYKPKKVPNYHYNLLEILEELIETAQPGVLRKITKFEKETIGCLWTPIELAGDYNTQLKALNIFSVLLKQFDENRQIEELNAIKWTNLNFFQEKLKAVVQATNLSHVLQNLSRELLNNYNMNLSKTMMVYSFYCVSVTFANQYKFYKPLNLQKFWIDINYCPKSLSFYGRYKSRSSSKYEIISVILKIRKISLKNNNLQVYFHKPGDFSKYFECFSSVDANVFEFILPDEERQRLINNSYVIEYFNNLEKSNTIKNKHTEGNTFDLLKNDKEMSLKENKIKKASNNSSSKLFKDIENSQIDFCSKKNVTNTKNFYDVLKQNNDEILPGDDLDITSKLICKSADESLKTSINIENEIGIRPKRSVRTANKFFKSFIMDGSFDDSKDEMPKRKRKRKSRPRQPKSRCKQVCKVTPTVDLTKIENMDSLVHNGTKANAKEVNTSSLKDNSLTNKFTCLDTQRCDKVLRQVADIYELGDITYAKPCQSYRNFQVQSKPCNMALKGCKKKINPENQASVVKKRKLNYNLQENKENENPQTKKNAATILHPTCKTTTIVSPHLFETQASDETLPLHKDKSNVNVLSSSSECEEVRDVDENILQDINHICVPDGTMMASSSNATTPRPTSAMNVSDLSDSDIEITQINNYRQQQQQQTNLDHDDMILDLELLELHNNSNVILRPPSANNRESTVNCQDNCEVFSQRFEEDFEDNSDTGFDSNCLAPIKKTISDLMANHLSNIDNDFNKKCIIFKNRQEETDSSDEDTSNSNVCNKKIANVQQNPLVLNQSSCQRNDSCTSPDGNFQISSNTTTRTATSCQVTPTAIIMHKVQVSTEKSIILKKGETKKQSRAKKCLSSSFVNEKKKSEQFPRRYYALRSQHLNALKEISNGPAFNKSLTFSTNLINIHDMENDLCTYKLRKQCTNKPLQKDGGISGHQQSSSKNSSLTKDFENKSLSRRATVRSSNNAFKNDLLQILNNYNTNMNKGVDSILRDGIKNISDKYTLHFLEMAKSILKSTNENKLKLEEIRSGIGTLVRKLEWQYDAFIKKSNEFDIHSEMCKRILENVKATEVPDFITREYEEIFKNIHTEQNVVFQNVWRNFVEGNKAKYEKENNAKS